MLQYLNTRHRLREPLFLGILSLFCFALSLFRVSYTDSQTFLFLNWNLFLAFVPWALSGWAIRNSSARFTRFSLWIVLPAWILFFPNAPYILTDLFHLKKKLLMPVWFDLILIMSFAWTGLLFGFLSLLDIEQLMARKLKQGYVTVISILLLFLGSYGIYLGRYLRWNSWDLLTEPFRLVYDISDHLTHPFAHPRVWGMTLFMGLFLNMVYASFKWIRSRETPI